VGGFMALKLIYVTLKSTSSNGWEYFIVWKDLGSSPMYVNCMLFICYYF